MVITINQNNIIYNHKKYYLFHILFFYVDKIFILFHIKTNKFYKFITIKRIYNISYYLYFIDKFIILFHK